MTAMDQMIEAGAKALHDTVHPHRKWERAGPIRQEQWRSEAESVLRAALPILGKELASRVDDRSVQARPARLAEIMEGG